MSSPMYVFKTQVAREDGVTLDDDNNTLRPRCYLVQFSHVFQFNCFDHL